MRFISFTHNGQAGVGWLSHAAATEFVNLSALGPQFSGD
jgi:hypothetical protein